jgi:hypothetical protein
MDDRVYDWESGSDESADFDSKKGPLVLSTSEEVYEHCVQLVNTQISRAKENMVRMNKSVARDGRTKTILYTVLGRAQLKQLFMYLSRDEYAITRLAPLLGAPPYHFIHAHESTWYNASAFSSGRKNMGEVSCVPSYSQFRPHLVDEHRRQYQLEGGGGTVPLLLNQDARSDHGIEMGYCRIPKMSLANKRVLLQRHETKRSLHFPHSGEELILKFVSLVLKTFKCKTLNIRVRILRVMPRDVNSNTAVVYFNIL